jgi:hypothetical protein
LPPPPSPPPPLPALTAPLRSPRHYRAGASGILRAWALVLLQWAGCRLGGARAQDVCEVSEAGRAEPAEAMYTVRLPRDSDAPPGGVVREIEARYIFSTIGPMEHPGEAPLGSVAAGGIDQACPEGPDGSVLMCSREYLGADLGRDLGKDLELQWHSSQSAATPRVCGGAGAWIIERMR